MTQTWWQTLIVSILGIVTTTLLPILVTYLVTWLKKKKVAVEMETVWSAVNVAVNYAEQYWKKALNAGAPPKDKEAEAMKIATGKLEELMKQWKLPAMPQDKMTGLIEAKLGEINSKKV